MDPFISDHISYKEAVRSYEAVRLGIENKPSQIALLNMKNVARNVFEPTRLYFAVPIYVSSFFRCPDLNISIGGSATSSHPMGEAIDVDADVYNKKLRDGTILRNRDIFYYILNNLSFDQLIWEHGDLINPNWVHFSYRSKRENRNEVLQATKWKDEKTGKMKTIYIPWNN
jgi:hypothetical protein